jgi:hypothetical protein
MKKIVKLSLLIAIMFMCIIFILNTKVSATEDGYYQYEILEDNTIEITKYTGYNTVEIIPSQIEGKNVTSIGEYAFRGCTKLEEIIIPNSVTSIGYVAFEDCSSLTEITIPNSVVIIGSGAFNNCTSLAKVTIPNSVVTIGNGAFSNTKLTEVTIPNSVTDLGNGAFGSCRNLTKINIPTSITSIEDSVFSGCTSLTQITIPNNISSIGDWAFSGCTSLAEITIPNSVTSIGNYAFDRCIGLTTIIVPNSVTTIGAGAFRDCTGLTKIRIPDSVIKMGDSICSGSTGELYITISKNANYNIRKAIFFFYGKVYITMEEGITSIEDNAFNGTNLIKITIPNSVTSIGNKAFYGCTELKEIMLPNKLTRIENECFSGCTSLTKVTIPDSVKIIGDYVFYKCTSLTEITIPDKSTIIGDYAFSNCTSLTKAIVPESVTRIGDWAFESCPNLVIYLKEKSAMHQYAEEYDLKYKIETEQKSISIASCTIPKTVANQNYTGKSIKPNITIKNRTATLKNGTDYTISYKNNINPGTATITITGKGNYTGSISKTFKIVVGQTKGITTNAQTTNTITVKWTKDTAVTGYEVYMATSKNGKYSKVATITKNSTTSYKKTELTAGKTYYFKVRAYKTINGKKSYGAYSEILTTTTKTKTPTISNVTAGSKKATVKWGKVSGATGYEVYMATSKNGKYSKITTITKNSTVSYTKTKLTKGKTYYFKVRTYRTVNGKKIYSGYSSIKNVKVK